MLTTESKRFLRGAHVRLQLVGIALLPIAIGSTFFALICESVPSAIISAAFFTTSIGIFGYAGSLRADIQRHTISVIDDTEKSIDFLKNCGALGKSLQQIRASSPSNSFESIATQDKIDILFKDGKLLMTGFHVTLNKVLNQFERIAIFVESRDLADEIMFEYYGGIVVRLMDDIKHLLQVLRNSPSVNGHPFGDIEKQDLYINVERLYKRWKPIYEATHPS